MSIFFGSSYLLKLYEQAICYDLGLIVQILCLNSYRIFYVLGETTDSFFIKMLDTSVVDPLVQ